MSADAGGRPRQWLDERYLLIETFGSRLTRFAVVDTTDGSQQDLFGSNERSLSNPRVSPDGRSLAFDMTRPGGTPSVMVAPLAIDSPAPESDWVLVEESASHPFWSRDGKLLYYFGMTPNADLRGTIRARRFDPGSRAGVGESFHVMTLGEMVAFARIAGATPVAAPDQIVLALGYFRGDIWMMDLDR